MKDINLLPEDIKSASSYSPGSGSGTGSMLKVVPILVLLILFIVGTLIAPKVYIGGLESELSKIEKEIADPKFDVVKNVNKDIAAVKKVIDSKNDVMETVDKNVYPINEILVAVNNSVPKGTSLNRIEYKNNKIKLVGYTDDILAIAELVAKIHRLDSIQIASDIIVDQTNQFTVQLIVGDGKEGK